ncbi:MAG TPA: TatD family hydrolase [Rectinemataceae bacterium]|nr:TatD family hydrolase [Rectinemataceae bacterium]
MNGPSLAGAPLSGAGPEGETHQGAGDMVGAVYTDSHAHLGLVAERIGEAAVADFLGAYAVAARSGTGGPLLLDPGVDPADLQTRLRFAARLLGIEAGADGRLRFPDWLRFAAGIWPGKPSLEDPEEAARVLCQSIDAAAKIGVEVAAIGECGFDFYHMEADEASQARLFGMQIEIAVERRLPLMIHTRDAARATLDSIAGAADIPIIIHCFGYGPEEARAFLDRGAYISFAGNISYKKSQALREALALVPDDRLLLETDSPYMNPEPLRGKASTPLDVARSYALAASIRDTSIEALADLISRNAASLFSPGT